MIGFQVSLQFVITQHTRDRGLLEHIGDYLGCGGVKTSNSRIYILFFKVTRFSDNFTKIIPFFQNTSQDVMIQGVKREDFNSWCRAAELINAKKHLTPEGLEEIRQLKDGMNKGRPVISESDV